MAWVPNVSVEAAILSGCRLSYGYPADIKVAITPVSTKRRRCVWPLIDEATIQRRRKMGRTLKLPKLRQSGFQRIACIASFSSSLADENF